MAAGCCYDCVLLAEASSGELGKRSLKVSVRCWNTKGSGFEGVDSACLERKNCASAAIALLERCYKSLGEFSEKSYGLRLISLP